MPYKRVPDSEHGSEKGSNNLSEDEPINIVLDIGVGKTLSKKKEREDQ